MFSVRFRDDNGLKLKGKLTGKTLKELKNNAYDIVSKHVKSKVRSGFNFSIINEKTKAKQNFIASTPSFGKIKIDEC